MDYYDDDEFDISDYVSDTEQFTIMEDGSTVDSYAGTVTTPDGVVYGEDTVSFIPGVSQSTINNIVNQLTAQAGTAAGKWISKQIGGSTVLYRQNSGAIGTTNIKNLMVPAAIVAGLFFLEGK